MTERDTLMLAEEILQKVLDRTGDFKVAGTVTNIEVRRQDSYTVVRFNALVDGRPISSFGVSKCNCSDTFNEKIGFQLAMHRAAKNIC